MRSVQLIKRNLGHYWRTNAAVVGGVAVAVAVLAGALLVGWALAAVFAPTSPVVVAVLTALLGGSILLNVFKEELPSTGRSSYPWFLVGLVLYAGLLALVTAVGE
jgi:hypothetical protein